jgi:hypothetical protein
MRYKRPNQDNVNIGDFFATEHGGFTFIEEITSIRARYVSSLNNTGFVKGYYNDSVIRKPTGEILVGKKANRSLIEHLEKVVKKH